MGQSVGLMLMHQYWNDVRTHAAFVRLFLPHQWLKHVDEQGRPYYYSADGSRSEWELPKVS